MGIPQLIMIALISINIGINLAKHGEPQDTNYNVIVALIAAVIQIGLLYWGGFFS